MRSKCNNAVLNVWNKTSSYYLLYASQLRCFTVCNNLKQCNLLLNRSLLHKYSGPGRSVGIATSYGVDGPGIESRWGRARFSAPVQTGPGAHPASCTMGTRGKERPGRDADPSSPSSAVVNKE